MRDREFLNEGYYGSYGQNPNRHTGGSSHGYNDWASRASDEAQPDYGQQTINSRYSGYRQGNQANYNQQHGYTQNNQYNRQNRYGHQPPQGLTNRYHDYDNSFSERGRIGYSDNERRVYNSRSQYAIPGPDPDTGRYQQYSPNPAEPHENYDRGLGAQFKDEVRSWFGNEEAARRRRMDERDSLGAAWHGHNEVHNFNEHDNRDRYYDQERDRNWVRNHNMNNGW